MGKDSINADTKSDQISDRSDDLRLNRFECRGCGYIYDPKEGLRKYKIPKGTPFKEIDRQKYRCPVCRASVDAYKDIGAKFKPAEGFEENIQYGFGFNTLPPGQKNVLIFGGLALAAACFLSLYSLH
ncbi:MULTISPECIES: rubredoxin [Prochlorococcus]|uniref:rubredoxin n=1 Tax=Prochlorococcus sp. MIT 0601 TaxID=1499498 RepID=UPI001F4D0416|nr:MULTISPECIES: rubredoxin [Prochlorococcus]